MPQESGKIRNVAVLGHRGSGKTSLVESLLFESRETNRLGTVVDGTTVTDHDEDEKRRSMSISATLAHCSWEGRRLNLIDTPGDPSFQGDALGALRVVEGAVFEISGVAGVEVSTDRLWRRADELGLPRIVHVNLLDRERADFDAALESLTRLSDWIVAVAMPMGQEHDYGGVIDLVHMRAYPDPGGQHEGDGVDIPAEYLDEAQRRHDELIEKVAESADELIEKYLEGEEITAEEMASALKAMVSRGTMFPVTCGAATRNSGTHALLDLIVEALPSPKRVGGVKATNAAGEESVLGLEDGIVAYVFKTIADPFAGKLSLFRVFSGTITSETHLLNQRTHGKERMGSLLEVQGKEHHHATQFAAGEIGAVGKLKDVTTGDLLVDVERDLQIAPVKLPSPVVSVAVEPSKKGEEDKLNQALRRLQEEDPTLGVHRDERTGEQLVEGLSQMHIEVTVERVKRRFGVDMITHPPRVPYLEAIRRQARGHGRHKKQTGGRGQFGDCHIEIKPLPGHEGYEFHDKIVGGVIPQSFRGAVDKGVQESMVKGEIAGFPVVGVGITLVDGSYHNVDSSEMAFKIAGSLAFREAYAKADPVMLEPVMAVEISVPDDSVGDITGDLNSRRGRLLGIEPRGSATTVRAEVPMAEMLTYSQTLTSVTGGRGDYAMSFLRYEEVPQHIAQKVAADAKKAAESH
jgi:elongation factor G